MTNFITTGSGRKAAIINDYFIGEIQDAIDLIANLGIEGCDCLIIHEIDLNPEFFDLKTGFAGEMLQKFSNYSFGLAIVGDFSRFKSKSLHDFIRESNKRKNIIFTSSTEDATKQL